LDNRSINKLINQVIDRLITHSIDRSINQVAYVKRQFQGIQLQKDSCNRKVFSCCWNESMDIADTKLCIPDLGDGNQKCSTTDSWV